MSTRAVAALVGAMLVFGQDPVEEIRNNLDTYLQRWFQEYVDYIITDEERAVFEALGTPEQKLEFIETFWRNRDPTLATPENEFREQYAARFQYANANFGTARPGWRTDRGRIFILLGPPTYVDRNPMGRTSMERPSEVWTYMGLDHPELPSSLEIRFVDFFANGEFEIVSDLDAAHVRPAGFLPSYSDLDYFGQRRAYPYEVTDAGEVRVDEGSIASERFNYLQDLRAAENPPEAKPRSLIGLVDAGVSFVPLPFGMSAQGMAEADGAGFIPVVLALQYDDLGGRPSVDGRRYFSVDVVAELRDQPGVVVDLADRQLNFSLAAEELQELATESLRYYFSLAAPPGSYQLHFAVRDNVSNGVGLEEVSLAVPTATGGLAASGLILADRIERLGPEELASEQQGAGSPFVFGQTLVQPNTARVFGADQPLHVYFQVYGLALRGGTNSLRVEYVFVRDGRPIEKSAGVHTSSGGQNQVAVSLSFDMRMFLPGPHTLRATIEDLNAGTSLVREVDFVIRRPAG